MPEVFAVTWPAEHGSMTRQTDKTSLWFIFQIFKLSAASREYFFIDDDSHYQNWVKNQRNQQQLTESPHEFDLLAGGSSTPTDNLSLESAIREAIIKAQAQLNLNKSSMLSD